MTKLNYIHKDLANGKWFEMNLFEQLGNIGSEVGRYAMWHKKGDEKLATGAFYRALELMDLTKIDPKYRKTGKLKEIGRLRETFCDTVHGGKEYNTPIEFFEKYFMDFAILARAKK